MQGNGTHMLGLTPVTSPRSARNATSSIKIDHVLRAADLAVVVCTGDAVVTRIDGSFAEVTGFDGASAFVGRPLSELLDHISLTHVDGTGASGFAAMPDVLASVIASGEEKRITTLATTADGRTLSIATLFPGDGTVIATLRDVSDIVADRMTLDAAVRGANAGYWALDLQTGRFTYSDSVAARLSARERRIMQEHGLFAIIHKDDVTRISAQWQDIVSGVAPFDLTYRVMTETDGEMWQRSMGQLIRRADGKLTKAIAFVMDITEDMKNRADLEEARDLAKTKADFLARMSHEIRTPLNAIIGMADSLSDEPMSPVVRETVDDIETAAEGLFDMLSRTLDHAKLETGAVRAEFEDIDPRDVLKACADMWRPKSKAKGLGFRVAIANDVPATMPLDSFRLRQCLNNLVGNAVKFTETGHVTLAARAIQHGGRPHLAVVVQDTGIGMSADQQRSVFDAYAQADGTISRRFGGTGLGLSICRQLAALMGGSVSVRSEPGKGAAFILLLPVEAQPADTADAPAPAPSGQSSRPEEPRVAETTEPRPFEGLSVLCVEDNPVNQKVVERLIGKRVSQLHFASHGREALSVLNTVHVDVVLMDIHMPVMDGIETTMQIRRSDEPYANVIIIALTADPDYQQMRICKNIGMDDTIAKPVRREDILDAFDRTLDNLNRSHGTRVALR